MYIVLPVPDNVADNVTILVINETSINLTWSLPNIEIDNDCILECVINAHEEQSSTSYRCKNSTNYIFNVKKGMLYNFSISYDIRDTFRVDHWSEPKLIYFDGIVTIIYHI